MKGEYWWMGVMNYVERLNEGIRAVENPMQARKTEEYKRFFERMGMKVPDVEGFREIFKVNLAASYHVAAQEYKRFEEQASYFNKDDKELEEKAKKGLAMLASSLERVNKFFLGNVPNEFGDAMRDLFGDLGEDLD
jgi:hypothetical protein